jgi:Rab-like protein 2
MNKPPKPNLKHMRKKYTIQTQSDDDPTSTQKRFPFAVKHNLPFHFVSAADGTNVVRIFEDAIGLAIKNKENPTDEVGMP